MVRRDAIFVTDMETIRAAPQNQLHLKSTELIIYSNGMYGMINYSRNGLYNM